MSKSISFNLGELQEILNATLKGDPSCVVDNISTISNSNDSSISFVTELPKGLGLHDMVDFELQFEKSFIEPLRFITDKVLWRIDDSYGTQGTLEDFF